MEEGLFFISPLFLIQDLSRFNGVMGGDLMFVPVQGAKGTMYFTQLVLPLLTRLDGYAGLILKEEKQRCKPAVKKRTIIIGREDGRATVTCQDERWQQMVKLTTAGISLDALVREIHKRVRAACENSRNIVIKLEKSGKQTRKKVTRKPAKVKKPSDGSLADRAHKVLLQACPSGETGRFRVADIIGKLKELDGSDDWPVITVRWLRAGGFIEETGEKVGGKKEFWVNPAT